MPAWAAVFALGKIAPQAAIERVAAAVARLENRIVRIHYGSGGVGEERQRWEKRSLAPFGDALVVELQKIVDGGPEALRKGAAAVLETLRR